MLTTNDKQDIALQFRHNIPTLQIVREYAIGNPPMIEQYCSTLPECEQLGTFKKLIRMEAERIACLGIEDFDQLEVFLSLIECYRKHEWIDANELGVVLFEVGRWIDGNSNGAAEASLMKMCGGLSRKMF